MAESDYEGPKECAPLVREMVQGCKQFAIQLEEMQATKRALEREAMRIGICCTFLFRQVQEYRRIIAETCPEIDLNELTDF